MSSGRQHAHATITMSSVVFVSMAWYDLPMALCGSAACIIGIALTPDLDQQTTGFFEGQLDRANRLLGFLWKVYWLPYALIIPHRHWTSHFPVLSTLFRLLYALPIILSVWWLAGGPWVSPMTCLGMILGLMASDIMHWSMDYPVEKPDTKSLERIFKWNASIQQ